MFKHILKSKTRKITALAGVAGILAVSGTVAALQINSPTGAEEVPPIVQQVNDHEERIGDLETRADSTDQQVGQNTSDIIVLQQATGTSPSTSAPASNGSGAMPAQPVATPPPAPAPVEPPKERDYITAVTDTPVDEHLHLCKYTLYDAALTKKLNDTYQSNSTPCKAIGTRYYQN